MDRVRFGFVRPILLPIALGVSGCAVHSPAGWDERVGPAASALPDGDSFVVSTYGEGIAATPFAASGAYAQVGNSPGVGVTTTTGVLVNRSARGFRLAYASKPGIALRCESGPDDNDTWLHCRSDNSEISLTLGAESSAIVRGAEFHIDRGVIDATRTTAPSLTWIDSNGRVVLAAEVRYPPAFYATHVIPAPELREALVLMTAVIGYFEDGQSRARLHSNRLLH